jgi:proteasome lid subunit RPN8/RPN11
MNFFPKVETWFVPEGLLSASLAEMSRDGARGNEGICLWLGTRENEIARIQTLVKLRGQFIHKSPANIQIEPELMREVHHAAQELGLMLVAQIHSHGKHYGLDLSWVDLRYGISVPYFLSVVAPEYGMDPTTQWPHCGVHICLPGKGYVRLNETEISRKIVVDRSAKLSELTIGNDVESDRSEI